MDIQIGKASPPPDGSTAARAAPQSGASAAGTAVAPPPPPQAAVAAQPASINAARQIASQINEFLKSTASDVQFSVDGESDRVVVRVVDTQTQKVIRQMPSEEMLAISKSLDQMSGLLIKQKV